MKKIITLCLFALAMCFSTQNLVAQDLLKVNAKANEKANELKRAIKFDDNTLEEVYQAFKHYEGKMESINIHMKTGSTEAKDAKTEIKNILDTKLKEIFTKEQYDRYKSLNL